MSYKILLERKAVTELSAIIRWYENQSGVAATNFKSVAPYNGFTCQRSNKL